MPISGGSEAPTSVPTSFVIPKMAIAVVRFEVPSLSAVSVPARKTTREVASAPAGRAGCRAEQDSERSLSLPNLLLLTSILTLFSFGVATKVLILAISSPVCVASSCVLSFADAAVEHNTVNSSICTRDIVCLTHCAALRLEPVRFNAGRKEGGGGRVSLSIQEAASAQFECTSRHQRRRVECEASTAHAFRAGGEWRRAAPLA